MKKIALKIGIEDISAVAVLLALVVYSALTYGRI